MIGAYDSIDEAAAAYRRDHPGDWPASNGTCPACGHHGCFGRLADLPDRWACHSTDHGSRAPGCGLPGNGCYHGDVLDLDAHAAGVSPGEILRRAGYLRKTVDRGAAEGEDGPAKGAAAAARSWVLTAGDYRLLGRPEARKPRFLSLELVGGEGSFHRDRVDLDSLKSRARFSAGAAARLGDESLAAKVEADLLTLAGEFDVEDGPSDEAHGGSQTSAADVLVKLALHSGAEFFHDEDETPYATVPVEDHRETWALASRRFRSWLRQKYRAATGKVPYSQGVQDAVAQLEGVAVFEGPELKVHIRVAAHEGSIYVDLGRSDGQVVRIAAGGWDVVRDAPVKFRRASGLLALPLPERGGRMAELRPLLNIADDTSWILLQAWLIGCFRPDRPMPVLAIMGEQGSAKSTAARMFRRLVDPNFAELRSPPRTEHDLVIAGRNGWVIAYDNLSGLSEQLSDAICRIATGSGFATRKLYTDADEELFRAIRPVVLNGIGDFATRGDLLDRSILVYLAKIEEEGRRDEDTLWAEFETTQPRVLGACFDALSMALRRLPGLRVPRLPRMADFARLGVAAEPALDCTPDGFLDAYLENVRGANAEAIEDSPFAQRVVAFTREKTEWEGTATDLLALLIEGREDAELRRGGWPKSAAGLTSKLRRFAPSLREAGIEISRRRERGPLGTRLVRLALKKSVTGVTSVTTPRAERRDRDAPPTPPAVPGPLQPEAPPAARDARDDDLRTQSEARAAGCEGRSAVESREQVPARGPEFATTDPEVFRAEGGKNGGGPTPLLDSTRGATAPPPRDPTEEEERRAIQEADGIEPPEGGGPTP